MQQVNLLNPALIKKTELLNPNNIALLLGVLLLALLGYAWMENQALVKLEATKAQIAQQVSTTEKQLAELQQLRAGTNNVEAQMQQIQALEQKITMQKNMIKAIGLNKEAQGQSYAEILKALSRQSVDGLWITGLSIEENTEVLSIQGRAVDANLLPTFIAQLRMEPALKGKSFTDLTMQSNDKKIAEKNDVISTAPTIITDAKTAVTQVAAVITPPSYVEFVLHSVIDKEAANKEKMASPLAQETEKLGMSIEGALH